VSTARSPKSAAWETTVLATLFTRATGDRPRRREPPLLRPLDLRPPPLLAEDRRLDLREEDLRPLLLRPLLLRVLLLRRDDDFRPPPFRREDFRALPPPRPVERFRAPPDFRPEDPDRDRFLPPLERLDFLAAAIGKLRVARFVERIARFAHNPRHPDDALFHVSLIRQRCASHRVA
jgi:hypothetical protein